MRRLAVRCLCEILFAHPHFNFRTNIIAVVVPFMNNKDQEVSIWHLIDILIKELQFSRIACVTAPLPFSEVILILI